MEANAFQVAVIAELTALKYVLEQVGKIAFIAADLRPEHAAAMREAAHRIVAGRCRRLHAPR